MAGSLDISLTLVVAAWIALVLSLAGSRLASRSTTLLDHPNHRSSHHRTTSRAGGVAIFAAFAVGMFIITMFSGPPDIVEPALWFSLLVAFAFAVGLVDDRMTAPPLLKFIGQITVAALFIAIFGPLGAAPLPGIGEMSLPGFAGAVIAAVWIVGFMNAYNFMDGSNGLAGGVAIFGLAAFAVIGALAGGAVSAIVALMMGVAVFGFLPANLFRRQLFMGDSGSQTVSFAIAATALLLVSETNGAISPLFGPVIFLPFILDVTVTLADRLRRRQNILVAHRDHFYQRLIITGWPHENVAVAYMAATACCAAAAIVMLALPPVWQWAVPGIAICALLAAARRLRNWKVSAASLEMGDLSDTDEDSDGVAARHAAQ